MQSAFVGGFERAEASIVRELRNSNGAALSFDEVVGVIALHGDGVILSR
jgi:hypothetical protein